MTDEDLLAKKDNQIFRLKKKLERSEKSNERLKRKVAELELELSGEMPDIRNKKEKNSVKGFIIEHRNLWNAMKSLCKSWDLRTRNATQTIGAIEALISPDIFGVLECTEADVLNYIKILDKIGKAKFIQILKRSSSYEYYKPTDTYNLFKNYKNIRSILLKYLNPEKSIEENLGCELIRATANGKPLEEMTVPCTLNDLTGQKLNEPHPNDYIPLEKFKGDDKIREYMRREAQKTGYVDLELLKTRMEKLEIDKFGERITEHENRNKIILESTSIEEEDDDLTLEDFEEVK